MLKAEWQCCYLKLTYERKTLNQIQLPLDSLEKTLMLGKMEGIRRRGQQRIRWLDGIIYSVYMSLSKLREMVK